MSYILDALKKAERERHVGEVPSLDGTLVTPPQNVRKRRWPVLVGALLLINAAAIAVFGLWRDKTSSEPVAQHPPPEPASETVVVSAPPGTPEVPVATVPPVAEPAPTPSSTPRDTPPAQPGLSAEPAATAAPGTVATAIPKQEFAVREPESLPPLIGSLPASVRAGLPDLELTVHVFSDEADKSFVFINDRRYQEGETLREGPYLESIEKQGVVLSYQGEQFLLPGRW